MSKSFRLLLSLLLLTSAVGALPLPASLRERYRGPVVRVHEVEGVDERVQDGKLSLRFKDFLTLVLKNNTEIHLTRLDVMTAADAVLAAKSPFDPSYTLGWNTQRSVAPEFAQTSGADTLSELTHTAQAGYTQSLTTGQAVYIGFDSTRASSNNAFDFFNPSISSGLDFSITQPLLYNRNNMQARTVLKIVKTQLLIATRPNRNANRQLGRAGRGAVLGRGASARQHTGVTTRGGPGAEIL